MSQLRLQVRRGSRAALPDLAEGEVGYARDTREVFIGTAGAENVPISTVAQVAARLAAHKAEDGAHDVAKIIGAETPAGAQAKVDAHAGAATAHSVTQVNGAVAAAYLTANYYDRTASNARYMPQGMSPVVAAIIFGG